MDSIQPSPYLKSRLEAKLSTTHKRKSFSKGLVAGIASVVCIAIVGTTMGVTSITLKTNTIAPKDTTTSLSSPCKAAPGFAMIAYADENDNVVKSDFLSTKSPIKYNIKVVDTRNMNEKEIQKEIDSIENNFEFGEIPEGTSSAKWGVESLDNALLAQLEYDYFDLDLPEETVSNVKTISVSNSSKLAEVVVKCTDVYYDSQGNYIREKDSANGEKLFHQAFQQGNNIVLDGERYIKARNLDLNFEIHWQPAQPLYDSINDNPQFDLSTIADTLTFEVEFKDGSISRSVIDINFDSDGYMFATPQAFDYIE